MTNTNVWNLSPEDNDRLRFIYYKIFTMDHVDADHTNPSWGVNDTLMNCFASMLSEWLQYSFFTVVPYQFNAVFMTMKDINPSLKHVDEVVDLIESTLFAFRRTASRKNVSSTLPSAIEFDVIYRQHSKADSLRKLRQRYLFQ